MTFVLKLIIAFFKFAIVVIVIALILLATIWLINRLVQAFAYHFEYEVTDFFAWARSKLPKRKKKRKH